MTHRDMGKETIGQSGNRDISCSKCSTRLSHLCISESRGRSKDAIHPIGEIGSYISRENIL